MSAPDRFARTLAREFDMARDEAHELAEAVLETFDGADELCDEGLDAGLRSVFYTLERRRLMTFRRVEIQGDEGLRRSFFWKLRLEGIDEAARAVAFDVPEFQDVYASLPAEAWQHAT